MCTIAVALPLSPGYTPKYNSSSTVLPTHMIDVLPVTSTTVNEAERRIDCSSSSARKVVAVMMTKERVSVRGAYIRAPSLLAPANGRTIVSVDNR